MLCTSKQLGAIAPQVLEYLDRRDELPLPRPQDAEQKPRVGRPGLLFEQLVEQFLRFRVALLTDKRERVLDRGAGERSGPEHRRQQAAGEQRPPAALQSHGDGAPEAADAGKEGPETHGRCAVLRSQCCEFLRTLGCRHVACDHELADLCVSAA